MATIVTTPAKALPGNVDLAFTPSTRDRYLRLYVTDAPEGSELRRELELLQNSSRYLIWQGYMDETPTLIFDKGGQYVMQMDVFVKGASTYGGGYQGDPASYLIETLDGVNSSPFTVKIGQRIESRLGSQSYGFATLRAWVWGQTVEPTSIAEHGFVSPEIVDATTPRAAIAVQSTAVSASLLTIAGQTSSDLLGDLDLLCNDFLAKVVDHMSDIGAGSPYHSSTDGINSAEVKRLQTSPTTTLAIADWARVLRSALVRHMQNDNGPFHADGPGTTEFPDFNNSPIADQPGAQNDMTRAVIALADAYRAYEAHRIATPSHLSADAANAMTVPLGPLLQLHQDFLQTIASSTGATAPTLNPGASQLIQVAGFVDTTESA